MNREPWMNSVDTLNKYELAKKRADIVQCIVSAKSDESRATYTRQLDYVDRTIQTKSQLLLNLDTNV